VSAPAKAGRFFVQLGAYADKSVADHGASGFKSRFPQVSAGTSVEQAVIAGRGTMYRVRVGPLASEAESRTLCESLRRSAQPCVPVIPPKGLR
jgi:cell division protein FtsN